MDHNTIKRMPKATYLSMMMILPRQLLMPQPNPARLNTPGVLPIFIPPQYENDVKCVRTEGYFPVIIGLGYSLTMGSGTWKYGFKLVSLVNHDNWFMI